jgi:hypothetical protein
MPFDIVQMVYWLCLAGWFGLVLFVAMATPVIFRTIQEADPTLPTVLSVNLDGQHGTLLAMTVVANIVAKLVYVQLICAAGVLLAVVGQWVFLDNSGAALVMAVLRSALWLAATGLLLYGWLGVWPRGARQREAYIENADNPELAEKYSAQLIRTQRESDILQLALATLLSAMILFSATIHRPAHTMIFSSGG